MGTKRKCSLTAFISQHGEGAIVTYADFTSAADNAADSFVGNSNLRITIIPKENSSGRVIHDFSFGKFNLGTSDEVIFKSGFKFRVESVTPEDDHYNFIFREID
jgi:hypothetical protein